MHPHATIYTRVAVAAWAAITPAGDAAAALRAVHDGRRRLVEDPIWGWLGRCGADQDALGRAVAGAVGPLPPGAVALGVGTSKGRLAAAVATGAPVDPLAVAPGGLDRLIARDLGLATWLPCSAAAACSTGLACLLGGADLVERGLAASAVVGAAEASLQPLILAGFAQAGVLCGATPPQAFAAPTGFAPAEGAAAVRLGRDGPWRLRAGVRLGDAGHETRFTDPHTLAACLEALWACCPHPELIVCHATGTAAGDAYELAGLAAGPWRSAPRLCCKPWLGHALGASGAVELALALESPARRIWKLSLGFGGHLVAVALER